MDERDNSKDVHSKRTPILFSSASEFQALLGYTDSLRCTPDELSHIVGKYAFNKAQQLPCSLNGCNTMHWHGFVIETKDGRKTNCGQDCGSREFGVTWDQLEAEFQQAAKDEAHRKILTEIMSERQVLIEKTQTLQIEIDQLDAKISQFLDEIQRSHQFHRELLKIISAGGEIVLTQTIDKDTREALKITRRFVSHTIGYIRGSEVLRLYATTARNLKFKVLLPLKELSRSSLETMSSKSLEEQSKLISDARDVLRSAQDYVTKGAAFFASSNLSEMAKVRDLVAKKARDSRLDRLLKRLPSLAND